MQHTCDGEVAHGELGEALEAGDLNEYGAGGGPGRILAVVPRLGVSISSLPSENPLDGSSGATA